MKVVEHLAQAQTPLISVEIIPPKRGANIQRLYEAVESIRPFNPPFINVTSHSAEVAWEEQRDGTFKRRVRRKSPGTFGLCAAIKYKFDIDPVPHLLCQGFTKEETEDALIELNYLGIENILAIRGDGKYKKRVAQDRSVNEYASDLVEQLVQMNNGTYQEELMDAAKTDFCVGVACYPEKHFESPNPDFDLSILKKKQDLGAHYAISQMFFDNQKFWNFHEKARSEGVHIPILPGLKILTSKRQLSNIPRHFFVDIPSEITERIMAAKSREEVIKEGVDWAFKQTVDLLENGMPGVHFYIMQNTGPFLMLMDKLRKYL